MLLSRANSSFILLRLRLSIRLCAVFLAIFLPAALVELGCFFLPWVSAAGAAAAAALGVPAPAPEPDLPALLLPFGVAAPVGEGDSCWRGLTWIIFLERVGGGGRAKLLSLAAVDDRRRDLTVSLAWRGYGCVEDEAPGTGGSW